MHRFKLDLKSSKEPGRIEIFLTKADCSAGDWFKRFKGAQKPMSINCR